MDTVSFNNRFTNNKEINNDAPFEKWQLIKNQYKQEYPILSMEDIEQTDDNFQDLISNIAKKTGRSLQMVYDEIDTWDYDKYKADFERSKSKFDLYKKIVPKK